MMTSSLAGKIEGKKELSTDLHPLSTPVHHPPPLYTLRSDSRVFINQPTIMTPNPKLTSQIAIVGAGDVGATIAYSLIMNPVAGDILMVDPKEEVRDAQVQDLSDATFHGNTSTRVRAGTHKEAGQSDIIVMTAGAKQKKGSSLIRRSLHAI